MARQVITTLIDDLDVTVVEQPHEASCRRPLEVAPLLNLPADRPRPRRPGLHGKSHTVVLPRDEPSAP